MKKLAKKHHFVNVVSDRGDRLLIDEPHDETECEAAGKRAIEKALGAETVYEAPDAEETTQSTSVGYSRAYAANYDAVFGKN